MWRVPVLFGVLVWVATIVASGSINYLAGHEFGRTPAEAHVFAMLGASADAWKSLGPLFILTLWRAGRFVSAMLAGFAWIICFVFAVSAALGLAAQNRSTVTTKREDIRASYTTIAQSLSGVENQRAAMGTVASPAEYRAHIAAALVAPVAGGTVGSLSDDCSKDLARTRTACAEVAHLREDLAHGIEAARFDGEITKLQRELVELRARGGTRDIDPQATLISRLTFGYIPVGDVGLVLMLVLVAMVETVSAFAPVVLREFVAVHRAMPRRVVVGHGATGPVAAEVADVRSLRPIGNVKEYLVARIAPDVRGVVSENAFFSDYQEWCFDHRYLPVTFAGFLEELERISRHELSGRIKRRRKNFYGLRLVTGPQKRLALPGKHGTALQPQERNVR
jgi:hypothetical protein